MARKKHMQWDARVVHIFANAVKTFHDGEAAYCLKVKYVGIGHLQNSSSEAANHKSNS